MPDICANCTLLVKEPCFLLIYMEMQTTNTRTASAESVSAIFIFLLRVVNALLIAEAIERHQSKLKERLCIHYEMAGYREDVSVAVSEIH